MSTTNSGKEDLTPTEIDAKLTLFEKQIDELKHEYEMYFNGINRIPPNTMRKAVQRLMRTLEHKTFIRNTAQKFRLRSLVQRFNTYKFNWDRILREIENGTYIRDIQKARRNTARREKQEAAQKEREEQHFELDMDFDAIDNLDAFASEIGSSMHQAPKPQAPAPQAPAPQQPRQPQPAQQPQRQQPQRAQPAAASASAASEEDARARKIMELQAKLGLAATGQVDAAHAARPTASAADSGEDARRSKLEAMRQRLAQRASGNTIQSGSQQVNTSEIRGASSDAVRQINQDQERLQRHRQTIQRGGAAAQQKRTIQRASRPSRPAASASQGDEQVRKVYRNLVEAKRRCNEPTNNLSYDSVARSMQQQRERLRNSHGARDVDFKVVIKDGRAFLKPEPK